MCMGLLAHCKCKTLRTELAAVDFLNFTLSKFIFGKGVVSRVKAEVGKGYQLG